MPVTSPIGSSSPTSWRRPSAIPSILSAFSISLSIRPSGIWLFFPFSISRALAFRISSVWSTSACATISSVLFLSFVERFRRTTSASFAFCPSFSSISFISKYSCLSYCYYSSFYCTSRYTFSSVTITCGRISVGSVGTTERIWKENPTATRLIPGCFSRKRS